jgi:MFS family permease
MMQAFMSSIPAKQKKPLLINRNYAFLWSGQAISTIGDTVFDTTLVLWIATVIAHGQSWAPAAVGGVLFAAALPTFLLGPIAGVFADRWDKRTTMLCMDAIRAILIGLLLLAALPLPFLPEGHLPAYVQLSLIYAVVILTSCCAQFFNPSRMTMIADVVDEPDQARASALAQISSNLAIIIGPPLAAPLLFTVGVQWALLLNALSFVISFVAILTVRLSKSPESVSQQQASQHGSFQKDFGDGLRFFATNRVLMTLLISIIIVTLGTGALNALDVFFVTQNLHVPSNLYGTMGMAIGIGSILGALLSAFIVQRIGVVRNFWGCLLLTGFLFMVYARMSSYLPALILFFCIGIPVAALNTSISPLLLHVTPREFIGRVISVLTPIMSLASMLSVVVAGWIASTLLNNFHQVALGISFGPFDTIYLVSGLLIILGGIYALVNLRGVNLDEKPAHASEVVVSTELAQGDLATD